jgi:ribosomal protein L11 methylase PrmA
VEKLEKAVLKAINLHIDLLIDTEEIIKQINESSYQNIKSENIENMIIAKQNEISKMSNFKRTLYEDWKNEDITREEYLEYKQKYEDDIERLKQNIERLESEKQKYERQNQNSNKWIEKFKERKGINELSRDIMMELIDCIYVHENGNITIKFKFEDVLL